MKKLFSALAIGIFTLSCFAESVQDTQIDTVTGAQSWGIQSHGVHFSLTQILPDQARAFYVNRGFNLEQIEPYAISCIYMTVLRNDSAIDVIHFISNQWSVLVAGKLHTLVSVDEWVRRLTTDHTKPSALIAFRWAQFPPEQEYEPGGDWNQGMLSIGLPAGSLFDVIARWDAGGKEYEAKLQGVQCAQ